MSACVFIPRKLNLGLPIWLGMNMKMFSSSSSGRLTAAGFRLPLPLASGFSVVDIV